MFIIGTTRRPLWWEVDADEIDDFTDMQSDFYLDFSNLHVHGAFVRRVKKA